jgi:hypothetical protein
VRTTASNFETDQVSQTIGRHNSRFELTSIHTWKWTSLDYPKTDTDPNQSCIVRKKSESIRKSRFVPRNLVTKSIDNLDGVQGVV